MQDIDARQIDPVAPAKVWDASAPLVRIVSGMRFTEGPVWHPVEQHLTFSDIPGNRIYRCSEGGLLSTLVEASSHANGNAYDRSGHLVTCEHATSRVVRRAGGERVVLADKWDGRELNSPNDVIVAGDGAIFFTDPPFGRLSRAFGGRRPVPQAINGVYRLDGRGLALMADDFDLPNGLCLSVDQRSIFIADTGRRHIRRFAIDADGAWHGGAVWAEVPSGEIAAPDGLKCDSAGNIFVSGAGGVHIFDADARHVECIPVPELVANFAHGGADMKTLFIAASSSIYRARVMVPGIAAF
ncbi:SMP-30/gluconolactonase/LRE family protein [Rhizobium sp.]